MGRKLMRSATVMSVLLAGILLCGLGGCAAIGSAMNAGMVIVSWRGKTPTAVKAAWGAPTMDLSGVELQAHQEYCPTRTDHYGPVSITKADDKVVELLVYKPAPGTTFVSADGKKRFTTSTDASCNTVIALGVYANGTIANPIMRVDSSKAWSTNYRQVR